MAAKRRSPRPHLVRTRHPKFHVPEYGRGKTIYYDSKWKKYSEMVRIDLIAEAQESIRRLENEFDKSRQLEKMRRLIGVANRAANMAAIASKNERLSQEERVESAKIAGMYRVAQVSLSRKYRDYRNVKRNIDKKYKHKRRQPKA